MAETQTGLKKVAARNRPRRITRRQRSGPRPRLALWADLHALPDSARQARRKLRRRNLRVGAAGLERLEPPPPLSHLPAETYRSATKSRRSLIGLARGSR